MGLQGERSAGASGNNKTKKKSILSESNKFIIMYTNADSLLNKRQDLLYHIDSAEIKPKIIAICEVIPKIHMSILQSEFSLPGYNLVSNIGEDNVYNNRGILIYIDEKIDSALVELKTQFKEFLAIKISNYSDLKQDLLLVVIYRSPNSEQENNLN